MSEPIKFWRGTGKWGCFSNFSKHPIDLQGKIYPTSEHLYQALKMQDPAEHEKVRLAKTPKQSKVIAYQCISMYPDWDDQKYDVMLDILRIKFEQHDVVKKALLSSAGLDIQEASPYDWWWGTGKDGTGLNMLGKAWMQVRKEKLSV